MNRLSALQIYRHEGDIDRGADADAGADFNLAFDPRLMGIVSEQVHLDSSTAIDSLHSEMYSPASPKSPDNRPKNSHSGDQTLAQRRPCCRSASLATMGDGRQQAGQEPVEAR